jgi:hypothetical protein
MGTTDESKTESREKFMGKSENQNSNQEHTWVYSNSKFISLVSGERFYKELKFPTTI